MERTARRLASVEKKKDAYALNAIQGISNYNPVNQNVGTSALLNLQQIMHNAQCLEVQKEGELKAARDTAVKAEHALHEAILTSKDQIRAQFGVSSDEYQSIGLKKKTEYKQRKRKTQVLNV